VRQREYYRIAQLKGPFGRDFICFSFSTIALEHGVDWLRDVIVSATLVRAAAWRFLVCNAPSTFQSPSGRPEIVRWLQSAARLKAIQEWALTWYYFFEQPAR
jgi:hypothetical protein